MPNNGIPEYFAGLRYIERKNQICYEGILKAQQNQEGDTDTAAVYLFLTKMRCRFSCCFSKLPKQRYTVDFPPVYGTLNKNKRGMPIYRLMSRYTALWQKIRLGFSFCLGFRGRIFFLLVAKNPEYKNEVKIYRSRAGMVQQQYETHKSTSTSSDRCVGL